MVHVFDHTLGAELDRQAVPRRRLRAAEWSALALLAVLLVPIGYAVVHGAQRRLRGHVPSAAIVEPGADGAEAAKGKNGKPAKPAAKAHGGTAGH